GLADAGGAPGRGRQGRRGAGGGLNAIGLDEPRSKTMKHWMGMPVAAALLLSACVTINVYFPAAEAKEAAKEFVEKVINEADKVEIKETPGSGGGMAMLERRIELNLSGIDPWALVGIGSAR